MGRQIATTAGELDAEHQPGRALRCIGAALRKREGDGVSAAQSFRHTESRCPQCDYRLDGSTHVQGQNPGPPEEGDVSICINCGQVLIYDAEVRLRKATVRDIGDLMSGNPEGWVVIEKAQMFIRRRGRFA
jgi:hypothetical protein